jgi:adenylate kinase family enzyme
LEGKKANIIYLISGPCGVGKSTIAKEPYWNLKDTAHEINNMLMVGCTNMENILLLARNFVHNGLNVVVDWIIQIELEWLCQQLSIKYVVLWANEDTLIERGYHFFPPIWNTTRVKNAKGALNQWNYANF